MSHPMNHDPELELAELCLDAADRAEACFEHWFQRADEAPSPRVRSILAKLAADEMVFANRMRADADDLLWEFDDGSH
jgi:hypothetical protein